jgi:hypothetical protein
MADAQVVGEAGVTDFGDQTIKNVTKIHLKEIVSDDATSVSIDLGDDAGDDFKVDTSKFVVEGDTGRVGIGTATPGSTVEIEGSSGDLILEIDNNVSNSANFQIQNGAGNARVDLVMNDGSANTTLTMKGQQVGIMDTSPSYGLDVNGTARVVGAMTLDSTLGMGTATPRRPLDILDDTNPQLRLTHTDDTEYVELQTLADGNGIVQMAGTAANTLHIRSDGGVTGIQLQNTSTGFTDGYATDGFQISASHKIGYIWFRDATSQIKIGTANTEAISIDATQNTTAVANLTANGNVTLGDAGGDAHTLNGTLQFAQEVEEPSAPAADEGGIFYVKDDGIPYFISDTTAETSLVGGGGGYTVEAKSAGFTAAADYYYIIDSLTNTAAITVTLPNAGATASGTSIGFKARHGASYAVTLNRGAGGSIDGAASNLVLENDMAAVELICDGSNWWIKS